MENSNHNGADDTDELLSTEVISELGLCPTRDHCDLLLDAIDAQLSRLQVRETLITQTCSHEQANGVNGKSEDSIGSVTLDRTTSLSKDTGLGTEKASSAADVLNSDHADVTTVIAELELIRLQEDKHEEHEGLGTATSWPTGGAGGDRNSKREQCLWRLERLLGTGTGVAGKEDGDEEDSVRTEDFSARFLEEMLEPIKLSAAGSDFSAPDSASDTTLISEPQATNCLKGNQNPSVVSFQTPRKLAGVSLKNFDLVTIDSDLDSVCTERVRHHLQDTITKRIAHEGFIENGSHVGPENQTVSSEDECVRGCQASRSLSSVQRSGKKNQSWRHDNTSTSSTTSATSKGKAEDKRKCGFGCAEASLAELQQRKLADVKEMGRLRKEVERAEKEKHTLHLSVSHSRTHTQLLRNELHKLQAQRDFYIQEIRALQESQAALQRHMTSVHRDSSPHRLVNNGCTSALEREEMDRLLDNAKSELFSEQRRFRHTLDTMQERLEEVNQELEQKQDENRKLREKCSRLEQKLSTATKTRQELQESVQREWVEQEGRLGALEKIVSQKELLLLAENEEKNRLVMEIRAVREEHSAKLTAAISHAQKQKELELEQLRTQMTLTHTEELQRVRIQVHEIKEAALREQAVTHTRHTESLHNRIQMKEEEVKRLEESSKQQQDELRRREETQEQVKRAMELEQKKWEEQRAESVRELQARLEKQMKELEKKGRAEVEKEKRGALELQNKVLELQKTVDELESAASKQTTSIRALRDEHQTELYELRRQLQKEAEGEAVRLKECVKRSEVELQCVKAELKGVRAELTEQRRLQEGADARHEQLNAGWAQDIHMECVCMQELLTFTGFTVDSTHLSHGYTEIITVSEAVKVLQSLRKAFQQLIPSLQTHITSLTHTKQQLSADKEEELRVQREQLIAEKEKAVNALRENLIQEHIEELSRLNQAHLRVDSEGGGTAAARLRRQLRSKDEELRQVQRNMVQWKEKTMSRLARKFEQELTSELDRKSCRQKSEQRRRLEQLKGEMRHLTASASEIPASSTSSTHLPDHASTRDLDSYKLLRHLQSRIRQLQADTQSHTHTYTSNTLRPHRDRGNPELAGSYLETIASAPDSDAARPRSGPNADL